MTLVAARGTFSDMSEPPSRLEPSDIRAIVDHMNEDHADALLTYCRAFSKVTNAQSAAMVSIDPAGFDLSVATAGGQRTVRLTFASPVTDRSSARAALISMLHDARSKLEG